MQKLLNYICKELDDLEKRIDSGSLSMSDIEYGDALAHFKKNLLTADAMMNKGHSNARYSYDDYDNSYDDDYSYYDGSRDNMSRRMSRRMSRDEAKDSLIRYLKGIEKNSTDEGVRQMVRQWIRESGE